MHNSKLNQQLTRLQQLVDRTQVATEDIELQGHWGRYLCVMVAGLIEDGLQTIYSEFASNSSSPYVARYVGDTLSQVTNPKAGRFLEVAGAFNANWKQELDQFLVSESGVRRDAIDSIMNNRNQIVHGGSAQITVARVREYLKRSVEVLTFIERQCSGG